MEFKPRTLKLISKGALERIRTCSDSTARAADMMRAPEGDFERVLLYDLKLAHTLLHGAQLRLEEQLQEVAK